MCCFIFNNKYCQILVHYYHLLLPSPWTVLPPSRTVLIAFLTIILNYFDYICYTTYLAGFAAYLASFTLLLHIFFALTYIIAILLCFRFQHYVPFPLYGIRAILFWLVIVLLCSLSLRLCLPETLVLLCCVNFLPLLAPP